jgi:hypothetical protein
MIDVFWLGFLTGTINFFMGLITGKLLFGCRKEEEKEVSE